MHNNKVGKSKKSVNGNSHLIKQLKGFIRIDADFVIIQEWLSYIEQKESSENHTHFYDHVVISILYRKSFSRDDMRQTKLKEKSLISAEQKKLHERLLYLGNKQVAHAEIDKYDRVEVELVIDNQTRLATKLDIIQNFYEPLGCRDFKLISELILTLRSTISQQVIKIEKKILDDHNLG